MKEIKKVIIIELPEVGTKTRDSVTHYFGGLVPKKLRARVDGAMVEYYPVCPGEFEVKRVFNDGSVLGECTTEGCGYRKRLYPQL